MVRGEGHAGELFRSLDDGSGQTHLNMPFNVAVEEEDARVVGLEAEDSEGPTIDGDGVTEGRGAGVVDVPLGPFTCARPGAVKDLEMMAVEMEGMTGGIKVVDYDLDDFAVLDDEGVDLAVDGRVGVAVACSGGRVQGRDLLGNVGQIVEAGTAGRC